MIENNDVIHEDVECFLRDEEGSIIALIANCDEEDQRTESIETLYPGQPEAENAYDETIPAVSEMSEEKTDIERIVKILSDSNQGEKPEEEKDRIILVPQFITAREYILKKYRLMMYSYMNQQLRQGRLSRITGLRFRNKVLNRDSLQFGFMSFRKIDRSNFYADVTVNLHLDTDRGKKDWRGTLVLWGSFDGPELVCTAEELTSGTSRKEEGLVPLSPFLVPYLRNSEVDRIAEKILKKYLPEAIDDPHLRNASRLAERMGLTVHYLPLYDHVGIPSVLMWEAGELPVMDKCVIDIPGRLSSCEVLVIASDDTELGAVLEVFLERILKYCIGLSVRPLPEHYPVSGRDFQDRLYVVIGAFFTHFDLSLTPCK